MNKISNYLTKLNNSLEVSGFEYLILFGLIFIFFFLGFAHYALENMNEGLYAEIAREMLLTGNYIIPQLNFVPYLEKPPMLYWLIAASYHLLGISTFAARLVPVTAGTLTCLAVFGFCKLINFAKMGWFAAIILAASAGFIIISRVIIFDMILTFFFTSALLSFYLWFQKNNRFYLWFAYALLGCAFLTKGVVAVFLAFIIVGLFLFIEKSDRNRIKKLLDPIGIAIFLLITVPWLILAILKQPGFSWDFFINEQVLRFLNKRIPHDYHRGPVYYYVIPLLIMMIPWSILLPLLCTRSIDQAPPLRRLKTFLWVWFAAVFIFFSISQAKAHYYIIIGIPALALLLALKINELIRNQHITILRNFFIALMLISLTVIGIICLSLYSANVAYFFPENWLLDPELAFPLFIILIIMAFYAVFAFAVLYFFKIPWLQFLLFAGVMIPWVFFLLVIKQHAQPERSEIALGQYILSHDPNRMFYLYHDFEKISSIVFYTKKRAIIIDSVSKDLYYGSSTPQAKGWFITSAEFVTRRQPAYIVLRESQYPKFKLVTSPLKFCPVAQSGAVLLLSNECG